MRTIPLQRGRVALVDDDDYDRAIQHTWTLLEHGNTRYAGSYLAGKYKPRTYLHRFILAVPVGMQVDHIDRDGLNCQKANLRPADHHSNGRNSVQPQTATGSGYRGVYKHHYSERWLAKIRDDTGKRVYLGTFETPEQAAVAYDEAALRYHGEFAILNFP